MARKNTGLALWKRNERAAMREAHGVAWFDNADVYAGYRERLAAEIARIEQAKANAPAPAKTPAKGKGKGKANARKGTQARCPVCKGFIAKGKPCTKCTKAGTHVAITSQSVTVGDVTLTLDQVQALMQALANHTK